MYQELQQFLDVLNRIQCPKSIEFRLRFQKKWLFYQKEHCKILENELMQLMISYKKATLIIINRYKYIIT